MSKNIIVVGGGLFGSIAAAFAREHGAQVTVIDAGYPLAGSRASGCVLAPSWLSALTPEQIEQAMSVLEGLYKVEDITFTTHLKLAFKAKRVNPASILRRPDVKARVTAVGDGVVDTEDGQKFRGVVLVTAGAWCKALLPQMPDIRRLYGASLWFPGAQLPTPRLHVYAPYRQAVAFNMDGRQVWMGDGTALVEKTWTKEQDARLAATRARAKSLFKLGGESRATVGIRPYVEGHKEGYFEKLAPRLYVSTGGAKNGTVLAAYNAWRFVTEARV